MSVLDFLVVVFASGVKDSIVFFLNVLIFILDIFIHI